jgi:hypothetical protein
MTSATNSVESVEKKLTDMFQKASLEDKNIINIALNDYWWDKRIIVKEWCAKKSIDCEHLPGNGVWMPSLSLKWDINRNLQVQLQKISTENKNSIYKTVSINELCKEATKKGLCGIKLKLNESVKYLEGDIVTFCEKYKLQYNVENNEITISFDFKDKESEDNKDENKHKDKKSKIKTITKTVNT